MKAIKICGLIGVGVLVGCKTIWNNEYLFQGLVGRDKINAAKVGEYVSKTLLDLTIFDKQLLNFEIGFVKGDDVK